MADGGCSTTSTTTVTAIRTTSTVEENDVDEKSRRQQRAQQQCPQQGDRLRQDRAEAEIRPMPDQFRAALKTSTKWTTLFGFSFSISGT